MGAARRRFRAAPVPDQPLNDAAFDPNDRAMLRRMDTPQPEATAPADYADDDIESDADLDDVTLYDDTDEDDVYRAPVAQARPDAPRRRRARWAA